MFFSLSFPLALRVLPFVSMFVVLLRVFSCLLSFCSTGPRALGPEYPEPRARAVQVLLFLFAAYVLCPAALRQDQHRRLSQLLFHSSAFDVQLLLVKVDFLHMILSATYRCVD